MNLASLAALADGLPLHRGQGRGSDPDGRHHLTWQPNTEPDLAGYEVVYRDTNVPYWQYTIPVGNVTTQTATAAL